MNRYDTVATTSEEVTTFETCKASKMTRHILKLTRWFWRYMKWLLQWRLPFANISLYSYLLYVIWGHQKGDVLLTFYGAFLIIWGTFMGYLSIRNNAKEFDRKSLIEEWRDRLKSRPKINDDISVAGVFGGIGIGGTMSFFSPTTISTKDDLQKQIQDLEKALQRAEKRISEIQGESDKNFKEIKREISEKEEGLKALYQKLHILLERLTTADMYLIISGIFWIICGTFVSAISSVI